MIIHIPNSHIEERKYIVDLIFNEFLGLSYKISFYDEKDYKIILDNNSYITIIDSFFSVQENENYLKADNIPSSIQYGVNPYIVEDNIPIIYGSRLFEVENNSALCGIDIFASSFFMLTRWEESVIKERDLYNRFPAKASVAYKNGFLDRPIVNEYVEMLWNLLCHLGINQDRKQREFKLIVTHDVDNINCWKNLKRTSKILGADILKRRNIPLFFQNLLEIPQVKIGIKKDPYDTFDYLMDLSEQINVKSRFYFMSGGVTKFDNDYNIKDPLSIKIIDKIKERGHIIGFHPSFNAYNDPVQWRKEKELLEEVIGVDIKEGRQHFLRFEAPITWNIWNDNNMDMDCTLGYADREGFRCGTCYEYPVFDFINRKRLKTKEYPLIVMEGSFLTYQSVTPTQMYDKTMKLLGISKKYKGNFVYLWHNSSFNTQDWKKYENVYDKVLRHHIIN